MAVNLGGSVGAVAPKKKKKKQKPSGGTIVPVGGETPIGLYSSSGQLKEVAPKRQYAIAKRDKSGEMKYSPGFTVNNGEGITVKKNSKINTEKYRYGGGYLQGAPQWSSQEQFDAVTQQQEGDSNVWSLFKRNVGENSVINAVVGGFSTVTGFAGKAIEQVDDKVYNPRNRVLGAASAFVNANSEGFGDWQKSWDGTYGLHYGQAAAQMAPWAPNSPLLGINDSDVERGDLTDEQYADAVAREDRQKFDPANPDDHSRIQDWSQESWPGKYTTMMMTLGVEIGLDPLVGVGKGIKATKGGLLGSNMAKSLGKGGVLRMWDQGAALAKGGEVLPWATKESFIAAGYTSRQAKRAARQDFKAAKRAESAARDLRFFANENNIKVIEKHSLVANSSNPAGFAAILSDIDNTDEVADVFKFFAGDEDAVLRVESSRASIAQEMRAAKAHADSLSGGYMGTSVPGGLGDELSRRSWKSIDEENAYIQSFVDDLAKRESKLADLLEMQGEVDYLTQGVFTKPGVSSFKAVESWKIARAKANGEAALDTAVFIKNRPFSTPVRVVRWMGKQRPSNWVPISGISDVKSGSESMTAWLNSWKHLTPQQRTEYYKQYATAVSRGDGATGEAVVAIEDSVLRELALQKAVKSGRLSAMPQMPVEPTFTGTSRPRAPKRGSFTVADEPVAPEQSVRLSVPKKEQYRARSAFQKLGIELPGGASLQHAFDQATPAQRRAAAKWAKANGWVRAASPERTYMDNIGAMADDAIVDADNRLRQSTIELNRANKVADAALDAQYRGEKKLANRVRDAKYDGARALYDNDLSNYKAARDAYDEAMVKWQAEVDVFTSQDPLFKAWARETRLWQQKRDGASKVLGDKKGWFIDENGDLVLTPQFETQLAGSIPLVDARRFNAIASGTLKWDGSDTIRTAATKTFYAASTVNRAFQRVYYRPAVLLSLKYTPRNLFDAILRNTATIGASQLDPNTIRAMGHNMKVRGQKAAIRLDHGGKKKLGRLQDSVSDELYGEGGTKSVADALRTDIETLDLDTADLANYKSFEDMFAQAHTRAVEREKLMSELTGVDAEIARGQGRLAAIGKKLDKLSERKLRSSSYDITYGPDVTAKGYAGEGKALPPEIAWSNASAQETMDVMYAMRANSHMKHLQKQFGELNGVVRQSDENYWEELHHFATRTLRGSNLAKLRLEEASPKEFLTFIRSEEGAGLRRFASSMGKDLNSSSDLLQWFDEGADSLRRYFPDEGIRQKILNGQDFTVNDLRTAQAQYDLPDVVGYELAGEHGLGPAQMATVGAYWNRFTDRAFNILGNMPESAIGRYPMVNAQYQSHLSQLVQFHGLDYSKRNMAKLMRQAERKALHDVKDVQYTVERYSNIAAVFEPVAPFFQSQVNSTRVWAKIIGNDPAILARANQIWNAIDGEYSIPVGKVANADVAGWEQLMGATGLDKIPEDIEFAITPRNIASAVFQPNMALENAMTSTDEDGNSVTPKTQAFLLGQFMPSFGGLTAPVANQIVKSWEGIQNPNFMQEFLVDIAKWANVYGADSGEILPLGFDSALPGWSKSVASAVKGLGSDRLATTAAAMFRSNQIKWNKAGAPADQVPTWDEAVQQAKAVAFWTAMVQFTNPFSGAERQDSNTFIRDEIKAMYDSGKEFSEVAKMVYEKYGADYAPLLGSSTNKVGGLAATMETVKWLRGHEDVVSKFLAGATSTEEQQERMEQLKILVPELAHGPYDERAAALLRTMDVPGMNRQYYDSDRDEMRLTRADSVAKGWQTYNQLDARYKADVEKLTAQYKGQKRDEGYWNRKNKIEDARWSVIKQIKSTFNGWNEDTRWGENDSIKPQVGLELIAHVRDNPKLAKKLYASNPEYWATVDTFLAVRDTAMVNIAKAGSTRDLFRSGDAKKRVREELDDYQQVTMELQKSNADFDRMFKRFFTGEMYATDNTGVRRGPVIAFKGRWIPRPWTTNERLRRGYAA